MANDVTIIKSEIDTDPLVRGYSGMTDAQVADDMNTLYRPGVAENGALSTYLFKETARDHANETDATPIYGRLCRVICTYNLEGDAAFGKQIFEAQQTPTSAFSNLNPRGLDACQTLLALANQDLLGELVQDMSETKFTDLLDWVADSGVMKPGDVSNIVALSNNRQSRAAELGLTDISVSEVRRARAL